ncbi:MULTISPECIES: sigma-E factor negative regulatory protein [Thioalkalivibrio]|uniref:Anti-sigma factor n=1 Tax=Thioalkalivibrio halophilus TaxID=252474 RepID=A0A1V3A069_9GAMM|nr:MULTISPECIES: sigma-E factor negative regulatory protein [Thioalkalivibrio]OOC10768.1 anti-sigma factor [Thioalkalivibrio halophilus]PYG04497.1 RseA-like anti sigma(E) protein [Thioalkalivibrio sp. ALE21]
MSEQVSKTERLSALVDDETEAFETRRLVDELLQSEEDRKQWERYHLIGDSLRGGMRMTAPPDLLEGVREQLAEEEPLHVAPAPAGVEQATRSRWFRPVVGTGVAAAVAVVTLVGMQMMGAGQPGGDATPGMAEGGAPPAEVQTARSAEGPEQASAGAGMPEADGPGEELDPRFVRYFENHADLTGPGSAAFGRVRYSVGEE